MSAPPDSDDAARLPCLTTGTPHAATTIAAIVDRLTVLCPSPPVPTMSTVSVPISSVGTRRACDSMISASSCTSAGVGRFIRNATANAAIWAGVAAPVMIWSMAQAACPTGSDSLVVRRARTDAHAGVSASVIGRG
ncbi:anthranilate phosphoribosyltransferase domain protein [Mycolicibacterium thermoresistibile]|uniref:Anthranilate phosphoribosyltransferase domain protein n=1 Tax=Mycolicibacterium thermoresistibile TaxID=1797 RepID=A0A124E8V5_MYCTH|nr:anthranilate phosphoribosyltransferase domain protein [Mycolicibacterium thermoresistibile]